MSASHETTHDTVVDENRSRRTGSISSFWFFVIIAGLFVAALNFISVMGGDEEHGGGHNAENHPALIPPVREATSSGTLSGETGIGRVQADTTQHFDTVRHDAGEQLSQ